MGRIGRGIAIGAGAGLIIGLIIGDLAAPEPSADTAGLLGVLVTVGNSLDKPVSILEGGLIGVIGGGTAGAIIGSIPNYEIEVNRDKKQFLAAIPKLKMYCAGQ